MIAAIFWILILGIVCGLVFKAPFIPSFFKYVIYALLAILAICLFAAAIGHPIVSGMRL